MRVPVVSRYGRERPYAVHETIIPNHVDNPEVLCGGHAMVHVRSVVALSPWCHGLRTPHAKWTWVAWWVMALYHP